MVECKDCKFYSALTTTRKSVDGVQITKYCDPEDTMEVHELQVAWNIHDLFECKQQNLNNDCKFYKRKWWKFWVKENGVY